MSYESKITELERILQQHNSKAFQAVDIQAVKEKLIVLGATNEDALSQCSYEDLESCGLPRLIAKQVASVFRSGDKSETPGAYMSRKKVERMTVEELLAVYDPEEDNAVFQRLQEISKGQPCIVFVSGNSVDVNRSAMLVNEIKKGYDPRLLGLNVNGEIKRIYKVGEQTDNYVDENPLYPGRALRPDGTCDQTNRSWSGVPLNIRQLLYLGIHSKEIGRTLENFNEIIDKALQTGHDTWSFFITRYPKAAMIYSDLERKNQAPLLKIEIGKESNKVGLGTGTKVNFNE